MHQKKSASRPFFAQSSNFVTASVRRVRTHVRAFTLIELLVVIVIIGILATISVTQFNSYQVRAREAVGQAALIQLQKALIQARITSQKTIIEISGDGCTSCEDACKNNDLRNVSDTNVCYVVWKNFLDNFSAESGIDLGGFYRDPWGSPYLLNQNEGEYHASYGHSCVKDSLLSVGSDGVHYVDSTVIHYVSGERGYGSNQNADNTSFTIPTFKCHLP